MNYCTICPNNCKIDREHSVGICGAPNDIKIAKYSLHMFEEPVISGTCGSGTIFFCGCSLGCIFCQNYEVSRGLVGKSITETELCDIMRELEDKGAHNINFVNPTHYSAQIISALKRYRPKIPIVWNTHGYEKIETLKAVNPYVDIYLTDLKYYSSEVSMRYSKKADYFSVAKDALDFMLNAKKTDIYKGLMCQGVIIRHLILPLNTDDSVRIMRYLRPKIKNGAYLSLMAQYTPFGKVDEFKELQRKITKREYKKVLEEVLSLEYENVFIQDESSSSAEYIPSWDF